MIRLRGLEEKDAEFMIEWMHDSETQKSFQKDMLHVSLNQARKFCLDNELSDRKNIENLHLAIVDDEDEYLGTVSLKNISKENSSAEYAIALRKKARGKGVAKKATEMILEEGFKKLNLHRIYLTVLDDNVMAIQLYEKCGFRLEGILRDHIKRENQYVAWRFYGILEDEFRR